MISNLLLSDSLVYLIKSINYPQCINYFHHLMDRQVDLFYTNFPIPSEKLIHLHMFQRLIFRLRNSILWYMLLNKFLIPKMVLKCLLLNLIQLLHPIKILASLMSLKKYHNPFLLWYHIQGFLGNLHGQIRPLIQQTNFSNQHIKFPMTNFSNQHMQLQMINLFIVNVLSPPMKVLYLRSIHFHKLLD